MATKTITLTGGEVAVTGLDGSNAHVRNDGAGTIYAAKTAGITAGADGVASIPAGQSDTIRGISGTVYLLGTGSLLIQSDDFIVNPFKTSAQGGSGADEVARAAVTAHTGNGNIHVTGEEKALWNGKADLSDIPASLPANGGNADTVDGKHSSDFYNRYGLIENQDICEFALSHITGEAFCADTVSGLPYNGWWFAQFCAPMEAWYKMITITDINSAASYKKTYNVATDTWTDWVRCSDGGNAVTLGGISADDFVLKSEFDSLKDSLTISESY